MYSGGKKTVPIRQSAPKSDLLTQTRTVPQDATHACHNSETYITAFPTASEMKAKSRYTIIGCERTDKFAKPHAICLDTFETYFNRERIEFD